MYSHVRVGANDVAGSKRFCDAVLSALGIEAGILAPRGRCSYRTPTGMCALMPLIYGQPGVRDGAAGKRYLAYLRDPSSNKICALHCM